MNCCSWTESVEVNVTEADYMELIDRKTAGLFSACARLGVVAGGGSDEQEQKLGDFAWNLGMAFQLIDDVLDFTAREKVLGKPVGGDLREGKVTLPVIYALQSCTTSERNLIEQVVSERSYSNASFDSVLSILERTRRNRAGPRARIGVLGKSPDGYPLLPRIALPTRLGDRDGLGYRSRVLKSVQL